MEQTPLDIKVKIEVQGNKYEGTVRDIVKIDEGRVSDEFLRQPGLYAWFATLCEMASYELDKKKFSLTTLEANLDKEKRYELSSGKEKVTEAIVRAAIVTDKRYDVANNEVFEASRQYNILKAIVRSLEQRKDMLIQFGTHKRQEISMEDLGIHKLAKRINE